jgi:zinc transporter ZupT
VHKFFGGHGHSHFPSQETLAKKFVAVEDARGRDNIGYDAETAPPVYSVTQPSISSASSSDSDTTAPASPEHQASNKDKKGEILSTLRSIMVVIALSVHSLFEGMAIGLEEENSGVWKLTLAITIHAIPIVFCVGTDMLTSGVKKMKLIIYIIVLSLNTPIGILIGIIVTIHKGDTDESGGHVLLIGILQGLAAGTLLYITFFEVLARDKLTKYGMSGLAGALAVMLGFALMGGMEAAGHGHSHGGGHGHAHDMGHHHGALSQAEGHLHMAHENHLHDHDEHNHDHDEHDHDEHGGHWGHDPEPEPHEDHDHDHDHDDHDHGDEHDHDDHDHEHEEHDHHDDDDIDADLIQIKSDDYFELNGTDYKFMHDM